MKLPGLKTGRQRETKQTDKCNKRQTQKQKQTKRQTDRWMHELLLVFDHIKTFSKRKTKQKTANKNIHLKRTHIVPKMCHLFINF